MSLALTTILILLLIVVGGIYLQIYLSKKSDKRYGLVMPGICLLYSMIGTLFFPAYGEMTLWELLGTAALSFLTLNIPTVILLLIYTCCREKSKRRRQLERMNVQDLE